MRLPTISLIFLATIWLIISFALSCTHKKESEGKISFRLKKAQSSLDEFLLRKGLSKYERRGIKSSGHSAFALIQISNSSPKDIYFDTCDSILISPSQYFFNDGVSMFKPFHFFDVFEQKEKTKLAAKSTGIFYFIYSPEVDLNQPNININYRKHLLLDSIKVKFRYGDGQIENSAHLDFMFIYERESESLLIKK